MVLSSHTDPLRYGSMLSYAVGQISSLSFYSLLHYLFFLCLCLLSSSLCVFCSLHVHGLKPPCLMTVRFLFRSLSVRLLLLAWSSMSLRLHQQLTGSGRLSSYELRQLFLIGLALQLRWEMTRSPPRRSNWTSNPYTSLLNPLSNPVLSSGAFSAVRSGGPRSDAIRSFHAVDLLDC